MKKRVWELVGFLWVLCLAIWVSPTRASAQTNPRLALQFSAGHPTLTITGHVGTVYAIQCATNLSSTSPWTEWTLVQVKGTNDVWTDPSTPTPSRRFYRAVDVAAPADTSFVFIQPGTFTMGSPTTEALRNRDETQHTVTISRGFWMGKYLVTQGDYLFVVGRNPSYFTGDLTLPVEQVSWFDATRYCALRTQQDRAAGLIATNYVYRLPTESEWEYADRAGTTTAFYLGSGLHSGQANFDGQYQYDAAVGQTNNPSGIYLQTTTPVGSYAANAWGLYDMIGNVLEWCQDWYGAYPTGPVTDPQGPVTGATRLIRGGGWLDHAQYCRSANRDNVFYDPSVVQNFIGFRAVLAQDQ